MASLRAGHGKGFYCDPENYCLWLTCNQRNASFPSGRATAAYIAISGAEY